MGVRGAAGIEASPDKVLQARLFSFPDTLRHRLGANFQLIPINCPYLARLNNYHRGGVTFQNEGPGPNYWPNSFNGPAPNSHFNESSYDLKSVDVARHLKISRPRDDYSQAGDLYRHVLSAAEKHRLVANISAAISEVKREDIKIRAIRNLYLADKDYGTRVAKAVGIDVAKISHE